MDLEPTQNYKYLSSLSSAIWEKNFDKVLDVLQNVINQRDLDLFNSLIVSNAVLEGVVKNQQHEVIDLFLSVALDKKTKNHIFITSLDEATRRSDLEFFKYIFSRIPDKETRDEILNNSGSEFLRSAVSLRNIEMFSFIIDQATSEGQKEEMLFGKDYQAFLGIRDFRKNEYFLELFLNQAKNKEQRDEMISCAFLKVIDPMYFGSDVEGDTKFLYEKIFDKKKLAAVIQEKGYKPLVELVSKGKFENFDFLFETLDEEQKREVIKSNDFKIIKDSGSRGDFREWYEKTLKLFDNEEDVIRHDNYGLIRSFAINSLANSRNPDNLYFLFGKLNAEQKKEAIMANDYSLLASSLDSSRFRFCDEILHLIDDKAEAMNKENIAQVFKKFLLKGDGNAFGAAFILGNIEEPSGLNKLHIEDKLSFRKDEGRRKKSRSAPTNSASANQPVIRTLVLALKDGFIEEFLQKKGVTAEEIPLLSKQESGNAKLIEARNILAEKFSIEDPELKISLGNVAKANMVVAGFLQSVNFEERNSFSNNLKRVCDIFGNVDCLTEQEKKYTSDVLYQFFPGLIKAEVPEKSMDGRSIPPVLLLPQSRQLG